MYTQDFILDKSIPHSQFNNYEEGMQAAKLQNKPVLLDFTGYGCVNCREMETSVWSDPEIANIINNDFILISLYVDDKTPLNEKITIKENTKETILRTIGDKWSYLQRYKFGVNAQPYYVILDEKGNILGKPHHYDLNIDKFKLFLTNARDESKLHK
jgi:thiol:disulfide interchange protein DsbD